MGNKKLPSQKGTGVQIPVLPPKLHTQTAYAALVRCKGRTLPTRRRQLASGTGPWSSAALTKRRLSLQVSWVDSCIFACLKYVVLIITMRKNNCKLKFHFCDFCQFTPPWSKVFMNTIRKCGVKPRQNSGKKAMLHDMRQVTNGWNKMGNY